MAEDFKLRLASFDKAGLKASFIEYLATTSEFKNFNPVASGMASILDLLAYNAHHTALTANHLFSELYLDTVTKRRNAVSRAAELGYTPRSKRASKAVLSVVVSNVSGNPSSLVLPAGSAFTTTVDNTSYKFITLVPYTAIGVVDNQNATSYTFKVDVYEGVLTQNSFVKTEGSSELLSLDIDTTTLRVFNTINNQEVEFYPPANFLSVEEADKVYFLQESITSYKVTFGDNTFGYKPALSSPIRVSYVVTKGSPANGAGVFSFSSTIPGATQALVIVNTSTAAAGGDDAENIDSIKINAKGTFKSQDRAVTPADYKNIILQASSNIKDILCWGGEDNNPPLFGKVIACIQPRFGDVLPAVDKENIKIVLKTKSVTDTELLFRDPQYLYLDVETDVTYDSRIITSSVYDLETIIRNNIAKFVNKNLSKFGGVLRYSNLTSIIDKTDNAILSNKTKLFIKNKYIPILYNKTSINFSFNNEIDGLNKTYSVKSTAFYVSGVSSLVWIEDSPHGHLKGGHSGHLHLFYYKDGVKSYAAYNIGYITYETGLITIDSITITGVESGRTSIDFVALPSSQDLASINDTIITINSADIKIITKADK